MADNNNSLGYTTAEEAMLFSEVYSTSEQVEVASAAPQLFNSENSAPLANISDQLPPEVLAAMEKDKEKREGEWFPKMTVRVNGVEVHGKKKNAAIITMLAFVIFFSVVIIFAICATSN